jgi:TetR/AcrR family transcriptional repressor of nem operon
VPVLDCSVKIGQAGLVARTKEFDPDAAVDAAMRVFWARGYEATSVEDLLGALGIGRQSMYATFGSKQQLYSLALDRYRELNASLLLASLAEDGPVLPKLHGLLRAVADDALADPERRGCFLVNAAMERVPVDTATAGRVGATFEALEEGIASAITRAQSSGEITSGRPAGELAAFVLTAVQGLRVVGKAAPDRRRLEGAVRVVLDVVR